jgi:hypothetical protein
VVSFFYIIFALPKLTTIMSEKENKALKNEIWGKYYNELQCHCKNCKFYHVQNHENFNSALQTTHRCIALSTDHRDEYSRGYYQILDIGQICPITNKMITSKSISDVMKIANNPIYIKIYMELKETKDKETLLKLQTILQMLE